MTSHPMNSTERDLPEAGTELHQFDADEWWDVARKINPSLTREQFEADLAEFERLKCARAIAGEQKHDA